MKVYGQLEYAQLHSLGALPTPGKRGLIYLLTTSLKVYLDNGTANRAFLVNDQNMVLGNHGTAANNVRINRAGNGLIQLVPGDDTTAEGSVSTSVAELSSRAENGPFASLPAAGNKGRTYFANDTNQYYVDIGASWLLIGGTMRSSEFNVVIGSAAQVASGVADFSTFGAYTPTAGDRVLLLPEYVGVEAVSLNVANLYIKGQGNTSVISGTFTLGASATKCRVENCKITGVVTLTGADNILTDLFLSDNSTVNGDSNIMTGIMFESGKTWTDNSTGSYLEGVQL